MKKCVLLVLCLFTIILVAVKPAGASGFMMGGQSTGEVGVEGWPATYHFNIGGYADILHVHVDGPVIHGIDDAPGFYRGQPVLGYRSGDVFYIFIDFTKDDDGNPIYYEIAMIVGHISTRMGDLYQSVDGTDWVGPTPVTLVPVSSNADVPRDGPTIGSISGVGVEGWPATYHFNIVPFVDVMHVHVDGNLVHGLQDANTYHNQPVLGWHMGGMWFLATDFTKDDRGGPIYYELALNVGYVATRLGNAYRTVDGTVVDGPERIELVPIV